MAAPAALASGAGTPPPGPTAFPVPSCGWATAGAVGKLLGEPVRAAKAQWQTQIAPILSCPYVERTPKLQLGHAPLAVVEFREQQFVRPPKGATSVPGLGSCVAGISCPEPGHPAWMLSVASSSVPAGSAYAIRFVKLAALEVEDGFNEITIVIDNPNGPLPVRSEAATLERLARQLLPRFYWAGTSGH